MNRLSKKRSRFLRRYYRSIRFSIPDTYPDKKQAMTHIRQNIEHYLSEFPEAAASDILQEFGPPADVACAFTDDLDDTEIVRCFHQRRRLFVAAVSVSSLIMIGILGFIYWDYTHPDFEIYETLRVYDRPEDIEKMLSDPNITWCDD